HARRYSLYVLGKNAALSLLQRQDTAVPQVDLLLQRLPQQKAGVLGGLSLLWGNKRGPLYRAFRALQRLSAHLRPANRPGRRRLFPVRGVRSIAQDPGGGPPIFGGSRPGDVCADAPPAQRP